MSCGRDIDRAPNETGIALTDEAKRTSAHEKDNGSRGLGPTKRDGRPAKVKDTRAETERIQGDFSMHPR